MRGLWNVLVLAVALTGLPGSAGETAGDPQPGFPKDGILPKRETGALRFLEAHPEADGRGIVVAIFDSGVDPGAPGLSVTSTGQPKILDLIDATGAGDVITSEVRSVESGVLTGRSGRTLRVPASWNCPDGKFHVGMKAGFEFYPEDLLPRLKEVRRQAFEIRHRELDAAVREVAKQHADQEKDYKARIQALEEAWENFEDPGPVYDCVVFHDGQQWRAAVDTDEDGDLADETLLADYAKSRQFATFDDESRLNFSVKIYDQGNLLSIVTVSDEHGTHVAGIVAANVAQQPEFSGLAPGAQIVSVKIGDPRLQGMETGAAMLRGLQAVLDHKCQLINMSFGEPTSTPDRGALAERFNQIVRDHNVIFLSSAGNSGPALSTVGAPGGTNGPLIGVGAYASPAMLAVEYSLRGHAADVAYTWTSRGPTADGDLGVDLLAPGGAISSVPNYSLQPGRQMHGTSMSSPNACGNIALMLSGLKQRGDTFTPVSILRSLQATAKRIDSIDRFAQGAGLVQVDRAYDHHLAWGDATGQQVEVAVSVPRLGEARGILLREPEQVDREFVGQVSITPHFPMQMENSAKLKFRLPLRLSSSEDWVHVGEHLLLAHDGDWIPVRVDPRKLKTGVHFAEILGHDAEHPERGPLLRIPVTVIRAQSVEHARWDGRALVSPAKISRHFLSVPRGAQVVNLRISRRDSGAPREFTVHTLQLLPGQTFEDHELNESMRLVPEEVWETKLPVIAGHTLEICLAQEWSNAGESELDLRAEFHGFELSDDELQLAGDGRPAAVDVRSPLRHERFDPRAKLTSWEHILSPESDTLELLPAERDHLWDGQRVFQLLLDYRFTQAEAGTAKIVCARFENELYDSPVSSLRMFLRDSNGQTVKAEDVYPEDVELPAGDFTLQLELRHADRKLLENLRDLTVSVRRELEDSVDVKVSDSRPEAAAGAGDANESLPAELAVGESATLWLALPDDLKLPEGFVAGDSLSGELTLDEEKWITVPLRSQPIPRAANADDDSENSEDDKFDLLAVEEKFLLTTLDSLSWPGDEISINSLLRRLRLLKPDGRAHLTARLHLLDVEDERDDRLPEVIAAADEVIAAIDQNRLQSYFGLRHDPQTSAERREHRLREAEKTDLVDALYRKARALAFQQLPEILADHPVAHPETVEAEFGRTYRKLSGWVDPSGDEHFLLFIRRERREQHFGLALERLNKALENEPDRRLLREKRVELYEELGWDVWHEYEQHWFWRAFPEEPMPF